MGSPRSYGRSRKLFLIFLHLNPMTWGNMKLSELSIELQSFLQWMLHDQINILYDGIQICTPYSDYHQGSVSLGRFSTILNRETTFLSHILNWGLISLVGYVLWLWLFFTCLFELSFIHGPVNVIKAMSTWSVNYLPTLFLVHNWQMPFLTLVLLNPDIPCLCKQCRSRSVGFFRSQLIWICTVCH